MALSEKELEKIKNRFENQNKLILKLYRKSGNKSILELLYLKSDDIEQVSKEFGISTEDAAELIRKNKQFSEKNSENSVNDVLFEMFDGNRELYNRAFEIVASSGKENPEELQKALYISEEKANELLKQMKENGDIGSENENLENSTENFAEDYEMSVSDNSDFSDASDEDDFSEFSDEDDSKNDEDFDCLKKDFPEKIIEALCFLGDVIQDTSEKICDALDESIERVNNFDFD